MSERDPILIDNRGENTLLSTLQRLLNEGGEWDVATGFFEIGALLALDGLWQGLRRTRIVMGDETTRRTRRELLEGIATQADASAETEKERDDFFALRGLAGVRSALQGKQLLPRVYTKAKCHPKAQQIRTPSGQPVAIIGSSNLTRPGLTENLELNLLTRDERQLEAVATWYEEIWKDAESISAEIVRVLERHLREYSPFEVWAKVLREYFEGREAPLTGWEEQESVVWRQLSRYQQEGYRQARHIADRWGGALVCDGVGLGKTFIGLMLLEYHLHRGDRVLLIVPKSTRESVWDATIKRYLDPKYRVVRRQQLVVHNQTDFGRGYESGTVDRDDLDYYREYFQVVLVDEAHHFRTSWANRSKVLRRLVEGNRKSLYFLTATPINNSLMDLYQLLNYLAKEQRAYFRALGVHDFQRHFAQAEQRFQEALGSGDGAGDIQGAVQDADFLRTDQLLRGVVIQRSRAYVRESEKQASAAPLFPEREKPQVVPYSLEKVYAGVYDEVVRAFHRDDPLLSLSIYNPERFRKDPAAAPGDLLRRDKQVVGLIRTILLKRLESSYKAFEASLEDLLRKMGAFVQRYGPGRWESWKEKHAEQWDTVQRHRRERGAELEDEDESGAEAEEGNEFDDIQARELTRPDDYRLDALLDAVEQDMSLLVDLFARVQERLRPETDDKLLCLLHALRTDRKLASQKVVIFTEFRDTARYLWRELKSNGVDRVEELDSTRKVNRTEVIKRFAPYYNCADEELPRYLDNQIRVLVSTDVLSEGLNLQDATLVVNYDLHWNPVRLMQRIGRVDRRLDPAVEQKIGRLGKQVKAFVYNFLPPSELDVLLRLFQRVTGKLLRISKTLGIEAPILRPDDDWEALRLFNEKYEGQQSTEEALHLEMERLRQEHPDLWNRLPDFPKRVFTGKRMSLGGARGLFCAYRFPNLKDPQAQGDVRWYFRVAESGEIWESEHLQEMADSIRSTPQTPRVVMATPEDLKCWREEIEERVRAYLRDLQAPAGSKATLVGWMEVS